MAAPVRLGRKRPLPVCPNPLFVRWLTEWRDEAASRGRRTQFVFQKALRSLRRYPLPLRSGKEAKILRHFGDGLCRMLDQRLQQHESSGGEHWGQRYSLTSEGLELAQKLAESEALSSLNVGIGPEEPSAAAPEVPGLVSAELGASEGSVQQQLLELRPGEYRVLLCVDIGETKGAGHRPELIRQLQRLHVAHMVRKLHVGDFVWVAQETRPRDPARPGELVLDHIVERKRMDDLCSSIIDGRFREQKFRLKRCGLGHRVYLVEEHGSVHNLSLPESTLLQAVTNTQVIDGFFVKRTADIKESAAYLALLTRGLERLYQVSRCAFLALFPYLGPAFPKEVKGHTLCSRPWGTPGDPVSGSGPSPNPLCSLLTFSDFNAGAIKNKAQSVREVFARQLMQVRGVSGEKAAALVDRYSTPASLLAAYDACATPKEQEMLLSTVKCGRLQRNLGPALSRTLSQLYCSYSPLT
ncbi:Crossover junction endonuclease MUS81 [Pteropus alecto]|uniref:Crossover junction endonuclease MUS81 n=1 Tax=Pteropus alecto TaxID=9402 RepID=L5KQ71_PTEAL|nr:Crossover junction endonuclease MUS81 [Pteropus alecto]